MILDKDKLANDLATIYVRTLLQDQLPDEAIDKLTNRKFKLYDKVYQFLVSMNDKAYDFTDTAEFLKRYYNIQDD